MKREEYIQKLEEMAKSLEEIINSEEIDEKTRIKAVDTLTRVIKAAYTMVKDIELEEIERKIKELKATMKKIEEEDGKILVSD